MGKIPSPLMFLPFYFVKENFDRCFSQYFLLNQCKGKDWIKLVEYRALQWMIFNSCF